MAILSVLQYFNEFIYESQLFTITENEERSQLQLS